MMPTNLKILSSVLLFSLFTFIFSCKKTDNSLTIIAQSDLVSDSAMVVSAHPLASLVGKTILQNGGNAIDANIATQFALAVVYPRAGNLGGGGFMVIRDKNKNVYALDYREKAPLKSSKDMYLDSLGNVTDQSRYGGLAVGVPGTVAGMISAHKKLGKIEHFADLVRPSYLLAKNGFKISSTEANRLNKFKEEFIQYNNYPIPFVKKTPWKAGDLLIQPELAKTLKLIMKNGQDGFYKGETARNLIATTQKSQGIISQEDLDKYQAKWREPIVTPYKNYEVIGMGPPSSGGITLSQSLKILETFNFDTLPFHSAKAIHHIVEAERRAFADRATLLGDMDFVSVPLDSMLKKEYLTDKMTDFSPTQATKSNLIHAGDFSHMVESFETTHTSVMDQYGNAVSTTTTLNSNFGSKVVVKGSGFFLNNEMDDFSAKPGVPNQFGLIGAEANAIAPEKRMLSSMSPTIVLKDGEVFMVLGTPGGSTIITTVLQTFLNVVEYGMTLREASDANRFHHQWMPDQIMMENGFLDETQNNLKQMGHKLKSVKRIGVLKAILVKDDKLIGAGDKRNLDDSAAGF